MLNIPSVLHPAARLILVFCAGILIAGNAAAQAQAHEGHAELPGVRIWYRDTGGAGVPVVFMHASTGSSRVWEHQIPEFTAAGYRLIMYDRRGWGRSEVTPAGPQPGTAADDLAGLLDYLGIDRAHIVATAAGGSITWDFLLSYPRRVRGAVIANNSGRVEDRQYRELVESLRPAQWDDLPAAFRELGPDYRATNPEGTRRWIELEHVSRPPGPLMDTQPLKQPLTFARLESIRTPVLVIRGGADLASPAPLHRYFTERVRNAEVLVVPDAGHSVFWERPEVFNRAVLEFIGRH